MSDVGPRQRATLLLARRRLTSSRYCRDFHAGLTDTPLDELPVLTKADLMANFDALLTNPAHRHRQGPSGAHRSCGDRLDDAGTLD